MRGKTMRAMAQITVVEHAEIPIAKYVHDRLPPGCQMKCFQDLAVKPLEYTIFVYGEMTQFWELEALMKTTKGQIGVIFANMV
jgi:hypothetical protein